MYLTFRWYGSEDAVTLDRIRQIPGIEGIVSALYSVPAGEEWPLTDLVRLRDSIEAAGLRFSVVESIPVHENIKLGSGNKDLLIDRYCRSVRNVGEVGVDVVCYNFMPVFDWFRTSLDMPLEDGSTTLGFDPDEFSRFDLASDDLALPGAGFWIKSSTRPWAGSRVSCRHPISSRRG